MLNISFNNLASLTPDVFAPLCALTTVDMNRTHTPRCMCLEVQTYLAQRHIRTDGTNPHCNRRYDGDALEALAYCSETTVDLAANDAHVECMTLVKARESIKQTRSTWMWILVALVVFLLAFMGVLYGLHLRNRRVLRLAKAAAARNRKPKTMATEAKSPVGGGAGPLALDVVAGNCDALLHATTKV